MVSKTNVYTEDQFSKALAESLADFPFKSLKPVHQTTYLCEGRHVGDSPNRLWEENYLSAPSESVVASAQGRNKHCTVCRHCR